MRRGEDMYLCDPVLQALRWVAVNRPEFKGSRCQTMQYWFTEHGMKAGKRKYAALKQRLKKIYDDPQDDRLGKPQPSFYTSAEWRELRMRVLDKQGRVCAACGSCEHITVDHKLPRSKFPSLQTAEENLQVLCRSCNSSKGAKVLT
jgi:hypothetical protein